MRKTIALLVGDPRGGGGGGDPNPILKPDRRALTSTQRQETILACSTFGLAKVCTWCHSVMTGVRRCNANQSHKRATEIGPTV